MRSLKKEEESPNEAVSLLNLSLFETIETLSIPIVKMNTFLEHSTNKNGFC